MPVDFERLAEIGAIMGSGGMVVMDDGVCMVDIARFFLSFTADESCGKCSPCRLGTKIMLNILNDITEGQGQEGDIELLEDLARGPRAGAEVPGRSLQGPDHFQDRPGALHGLPPVRQGLPRGRDRGNPEGAASARSGQVHKVWRVLRGV